MSSAIISISSPQELTSTQVQSSHFETAVQNTSDMNYKEEFKNLLLDALDIDSQSPPSLMQGISKRALELLPFLSQEQLEKEFYPKILELLNLFPTLAEEQGQMALQLGNYYQSDLLSAIYCLGKAHQVGLESSNEALQEAANASLQDIFAGLIDKYLIQSGRFQSDLEEIKRRADLKAFEKALDQIDRLKKYCSLSHSHLIQKLYQMARDSLISFSSTMREEIRHFKPRIEEGLKWNGNGKGVFDYYKQALQEWRSGFSSISSDPLGIRQLQRERSSEFIDFFQQTFLQEAFALMGAHPCGYDLRSMGSIARGEACPYSDFEGILFIESQAHLPYFEELISCLKCQLALLGETAHKVIPSFSCLAKPLKKGLTLDGQITIYEPLEIASCHQGSPSCDPASLERMLQFSLSLSIALPKHSSELFSIYRDKTRDIFDQPVNEKTLRQAKALSLFKARLQDYQRAWKIPIEQLKEADLKKEFVEVLNHLIADIALYFGLEPTNTLDIIDALDQKLFPEETKRILREAVSTIYRMRVRLHLDSKEQKEGLTLGKNEQKALSRICWLVLSPLYTYVQEIVTNEAFVPIHLVEKAIDLLIQPDTKQEVKKIKPSVAPLVNWLLESQVSVERHEEIYRKFSTKTILEPLREQYLRALSDTSLIRQLASIPNRDGYRQSFRIAHEHLTASIAQMCLQVPQQSDFYVEIEIPGIEPKQLKPEVIKGLVDTQTGLINPYINLQKEYKDCRHTVRSLPEYRLHLKERPDHPCMDYAVGALMHHLFDHGPPPTQLAKLTVTKNGGKLSYPILLSRTVSGEVFNPDDAAGLDSVQLTELLISQILTLPGDANARNFIRQGSKLFSIDNDVCFVEPVIQLKEGWIKTRQVQLTSILFCLKNEIQLDLRAIERFCDLDPLLILNSWLEDLITKEKAYTSLFSDMTERKAFLEKERERSFTPFFILAPGSIARLYEQFLKLQSLFREKRVRTSAELLGIVIGRSDRANLQTSEIGPYIKKAYERGRNLSPKECLRQAVDRDISQSMTSNKALEAQLGKVPMADELEKREAFSPEQAKTELFALNFQRCTELGMIVHAGDKATFKTCFQQMTKDEQPDLERQRLVLSSLIGALPRKMTALNLSHCTALNDDQLERIVSNFPNLKALDLRHCPHITTRSVEKIAELLANLEELYLSGCSELVAIETQRFLRDPVPLVFNNLKVLHAAHCPKLVRLNTAAIKLKELKINGSGDLSSGVLSIVNLHTPMLETLNCSFLKDYEKVKALTTLKQLKFKDPSLTDKDLFIIFKNNPDLVELNLRDCLNITQLPPSNLHAVHLKRTSISKIEGKYPALAVLKIENCGKLAILQLDSPNLRHLEARKCLQFRSLQIKANRLTALDLSESPQVEIYSANLLVHSSLECLDLSFNRMLTKTFLEEALKELPRLKQLYLNHCPGIGPALNLQVPSLSHLYLENSRLKMLSIDAVNLRYLNVRSNLGLSFGKINLPQLETLDVRNCEKLSLEFLEHLPVHWRKIFSITLNGRLEVEAAIKKISSLGSIQIALTWDRQPQADLLIFLEKFHQVIFAIKFNGKLEAEGAKALASALPNSQITQLDLWGNSIGVEGARALASALPKSQVTQLDLSGNWIEVEGAKALASTLPQSQVTQLYLKDNDIGDEGARALASALPKSQVTQLNLNGNRIGDKGAKALASALPKSQVTQLELMNNSIEDEGAKALVSALLKSQVTQLNLANNNIEVEGSKALASALPKSQVTQLELMNNSIGDEGAKALASALPKSQVTYFAFRDNSISEEGKATLREAARQSNAELIL